MVKLENSRKKLLSNSTMLEMGTTKPEELCTAKKARFRGNKGMKKFTLTFGMRE